MPHFIETIKILNGRIYNISAHNERCYLARSEFFENQKKLNLKSHIDLPATHRIGLIKCRITYSDRIHKIEFERYTSPIITSLKLVHDDRLNYSHKYQDRMRILELFARREDADDILMIKNGQITDTSYCNVALYNGTEWQTPKFPLLLGTQRQRLINLNKITPHNIKASQLYKYSHIRLFNAMIPFNKISLHTNQVM